ncbi:hypothetical protein FOA43_001814 [Brettanomyces nanus]|uniref:Uncharacterized protein n=1 Tax=Eeniella nana TaxID=13502 RepID=A0A875S5L2_EENNA|nr:uncharacterized protein FOA43_001814 [Brettanomyces nanus]QPG74484.1 hypothetical protein FOA43_001814 [Brettanomyces nanus]
MSLTSTELNYLIWRYLQEGGLDVSAYALQDETKIEQYEDRYGDKVPLGCLVDLVQKGILYTKVNELVSDDKKQIVAEDVVNMDFHLFGAEENTGERVLNKKAKEMTSTETTTKETTTKETTTEETTTEETTAKETTAKETAEETENSVIFNEVYSLPESLANSWNPVETQIVAWGQRDQYAQICKVGASRDECSLKLLPHPITSKDIIALAWSPKGDSLITASENGELRMWDSNGSIRFIMALHHAPVLTLYWSPDGNHVLSLDVTNQTIIWDTVTGQPVQNVGTATTDAKTCFGTDACWIDDYKFVVPGSEYSLQVYPMGDLNQQPIGVLSGHLNSISFVSYNPHLKLLCSASDDRTIRIWKGNSTNSLQILLGHSQPITYLNWLPIKSQKWYLVSCSLDSSLRIWDFIRGQVVDLNIVNEGVPILTASMSHDFTKLATADSQGRVIVWKLSDRVHYHKLGTYVTQASQNNLISTINWCKDDTSIAISCSGCPGSIITLRE